MSLKYCVASSRQAELPVLTTSQWKLNSHWVFKSLYPTQNIHVYVISHFIPINHFNSWALNAGEGPQDFFNFLFNMSSSQQSQICIHSPRNTHTHSGWSLSVFGPDSSVCSAHFLQDFCSFSVALRNGKNRHKHASLCLSLCFYALQNAPQSHFAPGRKSVFY